MQIFRGLAICLCALLAWGCAVDVEPGPGTVGSRASSPLMGAFDESQNRLAFNRLAFNRLAFNRLAFNRIAFNRLAFNRLAFNSLDGLETTPEGRDVLLYVARCALAEGDTLVATFEDETYEFPGLLGLAVEWEHRALEPAEARWVSACLITHVNAYDVPVEISLRAPQGRIGATPEEAYEFPVYEATFFGDVFGDELLTYSCLGNEAAIALVHASDRALRACADPGPDCEVVELGHCRDVCDRYQPDVGWTECWAGGVRYDETVSAYLRGDAEACRPVCTELDGFCHLLCPSSDAPADPLDDLYQGHRVLDCGGYPGWCTASCRGGACLLDASDAASVFTTVLDGAADISCAGAGTCLADCKGAGTRCDLDCTGAAECRLTRCDHGASCLMDCSDAGACVVEQCEGQVQYCASGVVTCNRPCPGA